MRRLKEITCSLPLVFAKLGTLLQDALKWNRHRRSPDRGHFSSFRPFTSGQQAMPGGFFQAASCLSDSEFLWHGKNTLAEGGQPAFSL